MRSLDYATKITISLNCGLRLYIYPFVNIYILFANPKYLMHF